MRKILCRPSLATAGFGTGMVATIGLLAVLSSLVGGCAGTGASAGGTAGAEPVTATVPQPPPIDLLAPTSFETASFALG